MAAYGLYTHIASNRRRSVVLLIGLFFLIYVMVFAGALVAEAFLRSNAPFDYYVSAAWFDLIKAAPFATVGTLIWIAIAYKFHQSMIDSITGARTVTRQDEPQIYNALENLCISRGIPMPALKVMDNPAPNAFATGLNEKQYAITVTRGLLDNLDAAEVEAVLAHELTHIRNGDVRMMVIAVIIAGVVGFFAEMFFRLLFNSKWNVGSSGSSSSSSSSSSGSNRKGGGAGGAILLAVVLIAVAYLLSLVVRFALSRSREYLADAGSAELTKNPDAMISALRKIENRGELHGATSAVMEMCVDNPREGFADLFATHPSVDDRVKALIAYAGGHDPGPLKRPHATDEAADTGADANADTAAGESEGPVRELPPSPSPTPANAPPGPWGQSAPLPLPEAPPPAGTPANAPPRRSPWGALTKPFGRRSR